MLHVNISWQSMRFDFILFVPLVGSFGCLTFDGHYASRCQTPQCAHSTRQRNVDWFGFGRRLIAQSKIQCPCGITPLQESGAIGELWMVRLRFGLVWGVGCILAGLLFHREPCFWARDNSDQLGKIIECLGTSDLIDLITYAFKYNINMQLPTEVQRLL